MGQITFVYGGTRSGKSRYASSLAASFSPTVYYVATAQALDPEMTVRIAKHRRDRPANFITLEEPRDLSRALRGIRDTSDVILVDCLTLLLSNRILDEIDSCPPETLERKIFEEIEGFLALAKGRRNPFILVSNEVGQSLVAANRLGRIFCDLQGTVNQRISQAAHRVIKLEAGNPLILKNWQPPFCLGSTSYVYPAGIVENVKRLMGQVEDIELILFEADQSINLSEREVERLTLLSYGRTLSFTAHLPLGLMLGEAGEDREEAVNVILRIMRQLEPLSPQAYILHLPIVKSVANTRLVELDMGDRRRWQESCRRSLEEILSSGVDPQLLCLENLGYPFAYVKDLIEEYNLAVCLDVGHLKLYGLSLLEFADRYLPRARVVHFHGCCEGKDHRSLPNPMPSDYTDFLNRLVQEEYRGVLTLEVFSERDFFRSRELIKGWLALP